MFTREFNVALILTLIFVFGTYFFIPPFRWVVKISDSIKDAAALKYGEPPYGHAELSTVRTFASKIGFDLDQSMTRLKEAGIQSEGPKQTLQAIAKLNKISPQQVYLAMKPPAEPARSKKLPPSPPPGIGRRSVADICHEYDLPIRAVLRSLADQHIKAASDLSIKQIAEQSNMSSIDVYAIIQKLSSSALR